MLVEKQKHKSHGGDFYTNFLLQKHWDVRKEWLSKREVKRKKKKRQNLGLCDKPRWSVVVGVTCLTPPVLLPGTGSEMSFLSLCVWKSPTPTWSSCGAESCSLVCGWKEGSPWAVATGQELMSTVLAECPQFLVHILKFLRGLLSYFGSDVSKFSKNKFPISVWSIQFPASLRAEIHRIYSRRSCQKWAILLAIQLSLPFCLGKISSF